MRHKYIVYNSDRSVKAEIPNLSDALMFIRENIDGDSYILEFAGMELEIKEHKRPNLRPIVGGRL